MTRPFLSVVMPTMRSGGLDIIFAGLLGQTLPPETFELVIADGLHPRRASLVEYRTRHAPFHVTHVEPIGGTPFPRNDFCRYANTALVHARGEVVVFITDYTWLPPGCLERHAVFHRAQPPPVRDASGLMCPHQYVQLPQPDPLFPVYAECRTGQDTELYAQDVAAGVHDPFMWSVFDRPFVGDPRRMPLDSVWANADPKLLHAPGPILPSYFHAKNESVRLQPLLAMNGWDEKLDGTHGWQDTDLAERLTHTQDVAWQCDPANVAYIVNPRHHFPLARRNKDYRENEKIWMDSKIDGYPIPNSWNLMNARRMLGVEGP